MPSSNVVPTRIKMLNSWARAWKAENLSAEVQQLITQATNDLYFGPPDTFLDDEIWEDYPGFISATATIKRALTELPSDLYLDIDSEQVLDHKPEPEKCEAYDGALESGEEWYHVERHDIRVAVVGKELSEYVK